MTSAFELVFDELEVGYGRSRVAGPLSGRFESGKVWGLTGPNGSGKTTLLRTLLGLLRPLAGKIRFPQGRTLGYVPQLGTLDSGFPVTCAEVVGTSVPMPETRAVRNERVASALASVGMEAAARHQFFRLSGGQRQRVLVARALAGNADVVALDEPTAGVDAEAATQVWELLREVAASGRLVVVVTHDLFRAPQHVDRMLALVENALQEHAP